MLSAPIPPPLTVHVRATPKRGSSPGCIFVVRAPIVEGGTQIACLTQVDGFPAPDATLRSRGTMTFTLRRGTIVTAVRVTQRFAHDGRHARQTLTGLIVRGTGAYAGRHGSIVGSGSVVDERASLGPVSLSYTLRFR